MIGEDIHEECGVAGMAHTQNCLNIIITALHALQHRGQESAGVSTHL